MSTLGHFALFLALVCSAWAATAAWLSTISTGFLNQPDRARLSTKSEMEVSVMHRPSMVRSEPFWSSWVSQSMSGTLRLIASRTCTGPL